MPLPLAHGDKGAIGAQLGQVVVDGPDAQRAYIGIHGAAVPGAGLYQFFGQPAAVIQEVNHRNGKPEQPRRQLAQQTGYAVNAGALLVVDCLPLWLRPAAAAHPAGYRAGQSSA